MVETFLIYMLKVNIAFAVLYVLYILLFNKDTFLVGRRVLLLSFYAFAWLYPLFNFSGLFSTEIAFVDTSVIYAILTPEPVVNGASEASASAFSFSWHYFFIGVYVVGAIMLMFRTVLELVSLSKKMKTYKKKTVNGVNIFFGKEITCPYSFFKWIFLPSFFSGSNSDFTEILMHENTHVKQWHSVDILLAQITIILCWFNPFVWLLRSEVRLNHEYLADRQVMLSGYDKKNYQYRLIGLKQTQSLAAANLYNNFSVLPLKKRIKMLNRKKSPSIMKSKYLIFIPVIALLLLVGNSQNSVAKSIINEIPLIANENTATVPTDVDQSPEDDVVFDIVEEMPKYPEGTKASMDFIANNIKYPESAKAAGIQGRVIVTYIVEKDGSLSNFKVVRSIDKALDEEAVRVLSTMPKWIPGKQRGKVVRTRYTMPVSFKLSN